MTDIGEPGRGGRRSKPHGLVRPYVLGVGGSAHRRAVQRDVSEHLTRRDQPALEWTGDAASRYTRPESTQRDTPAKPRQTPTPRPPAESTEGRRALPSAPRRVRRRGRPRLLDGRHRLGAITVGVAALVIVGSIILLLSQPSASPASACGTNDCRHGAARILGGAPQPVGAPALTHKRKARPSPAPSRRHRTSKLMRSSPRPAPKPTSPGPTSRPTSPGPGPTASPTPSPTASPTRPATIQVSYSLVNQHPHDFRGQFTIVNNGSTAVNGWELVAVFPHDSVVAVWDATFHTDGNTLYIDPTFLQRTIAPGAELTENFIASGSTTTPTSCTFNGSACAG